MSVLVTPISLFHVPKSGVLPVLEKLSTLLESAALSVFQVSIDDATILQLGRRDLAHVTHSNGYLFIKREKFWRVKAVCKSLIRLI